MNWTSFVSRALTANLVFLTLVATTTWAQTSSRFSGTVKDSSGGTVSGAAVTLTNQATNVSRTTTSDSEGGYLFPAVEAGVYRLAVERTGFKKVIQNDITLEINQNGRLDVTLEVGQSS